MRDESSPKEPAITLRVKFQYMNFGAGGRGHKHSAHRSSILIHSHLVSALRYRNTQPHSHTHSPTLTCSPTHVGTHQVTHTHTQTIHACTYYQVPLHTSSNAESYWLVHKHPVPLPHTEPHLPHSTLPLSHSVTASLTYPPSPHPHWRPYPKSLTPSVTWSTKGLPHSIFFLPQVLFFH